MEFNLGQRVRNVNNGAEGLISKTHPDYGEYGAADVLWDGATEAHMASYIDLAKVSGTDVSSFEQSVRYHTNKIADLLISKNKQYANSALDPIRVFSKADRMEQLRVRADDKLSRIRNGDTSEDALTDLAGYIILLKIAEESN